MKSGTIIKTLSGVALTLGLLAGMTPAKADEVKLTLVHPFPETLVFTKDCLAQVAAINERGKGVVQIEVLPFNSIGMFQQPGAISKGRVDIACTPAAFYAAAIPENEAISTASITPMEARESGGYQMIDELHQKYFNAKYLGWTSGGGRFRIYMKNEPKFNDKGLPDFSGVKMRDNPIYGAFLRALNATTHPMSSNEVYSALEKGVVDATPWATNGLMQLKWDQFLRHAIDEEFYATDIGWLMNLDKWNSLSPEAKKLLEDVTKEYEKINTDSLTKMAVDEKAKLKENGMAFHPVPDPAAFGKIAVDSAYERMMERLKKAGRDTGHVEKLRAAFQK